MPSRRPSAPDALLDIRGPEDFAAAFGVSPATLERLATYERLLRQWQKAVNLVAPSTLDAVWQRHFADCAQALPLVPGARTWLDLGSGAGFPGLVIAILLAESPAVFPCPSRGGARGGVDRKRSSLGTPTPGPSPQGGGETPPQGEGKPVADAPAAFPSPSRGGARGGVDRKRLSLGTPTPDPSPQGGGETPPQGEGNPVGAPVAAPRVTLVESDQRKCAFLREVARQTGISVDILSTRAESLATQANLAAPDVVTARALAPLERLFGLAACVSPPSTVGLYFKGREAAKEIEAAGKTWEFDAELIPSRTDAHGRILLVRHLQRKAKD